MYGPQHIHNLYFHGRYQEERGASSACGCERCRAGGWWWRICFWMACDRVAESIQTATKEPTEGRLVGLVEKEVESVEQEILDEIQPRSEAMTHRGEYYIFLTLRW